MTYSLYYRAHIVEKDCWFLVAVLRSFEHLAFDRTYSKEESIFEFFVPADGEERFLEVMNYFKNERILTSFERLPNRLHDPQEKV